jgi:predicted RNase H-like HicB family nuclease
MTESPLRWKYPLELSTERGSKGRLIHVARYPDLPGCIGYGDTSGEAKASLEKARVAYISTLLSLDQEVPPPRTCADVIEWHPMETAEFAVVNADKKQVASVG